MCILVLGTRKNPVSRIPDVVSRIPDVVSKIPDVVSKIPVWSWGNIPSTSLSVSVVRKWMIAWFLSVAYLLFHYSWNAHPSKPSRHQVKVVDHPKKLTFSWITWVWLMVSMETWWQWRAVGHMLGECLVSSNLHKNHASNTLFELLSSAGTYLLYFPGECLNFELSCRILKIRKPNWFFRSLQPMLFSVGSDMLKMTR